MDIRKLDLNLLPVLEALYESGSVSAASRHLKISQPACSAALSRLRETFADQLFVRTGRGMRPTPQADAMIETVRMLMTSVRYDLLAQPGFDPATTDRHFTLTTSDIGELVFLPRLLRLLRDRAPQATLRCVSLPHDRLVAAMEEGDVDVAIGYFPDLQAPAIPSRDLFQHPFVCLLRRHHPVIGDTMSLADFLEADHLVVNQAGRSQEIFERMMEQKGLHRRVALLSPHFMSVPLLVAQSDMIATVPLALAMRFGMDGDLRFLQPPLAIPAIPLKMWWHRRMSDDAAVAWLRGLISEAFEGRDPYVLERSVTTQPVLMADAQGPH